MTIERMIELLKIEHECMLRGAHDDCDRKCADCELVQEDGELHEMYTNVVCLLKEQEHKDRMYHALEDDWKRLKELLKEQGEVVRCRDCVNRYDPINCKMYSEGMDTSDEWFCADGERR